VAIGWVGDGGTVGASPSKPSSPATSVEGPVVSPLSRVEHAEALKIRSTAAITSTYVLGLFILSIFLALNQIRGNPFKAIE
jgi:hypothetical protein